MAVDKESLKSSIIGNWAMLFVLTSIRAWALMCVLWQRPEMQSNAIVVVIRNEDNGTTRALYVMRYLPLLTILVLCSDGTVTAEDIKDVPIEVLNVTVYDVSKKFVELFGGNNNKSRLKDLKEKLDHINHYVVDNNLVGEVLNNVTSETNLNETNFYQALMEKDHFSYLTANVSKNLILKLKEKMTRDDILKVIAKRASRKNLMKSARRMIKDPIPQHDTEKIINDVVDKLLAETPIDNHKTKENISVYWDPQKELEAKQSYHQNKQSGRRIYRGERTHIRHFPFMASVHLMGRFWCGAVIYWQDLCITSASCLQLLHNNRFFRENPRILQVRIGSNHSRIGGEMVDVLEVYFHPGYNPRTLKSNLAVIRLRRHIRFTSHAVTKYIAIDKHIHSPPPTAEVLLLGWGVTKVSQKLSYEPIFLQKKILPVYPNTFCRDVYGDKFMPETMFCAGTLTTGEGACDHDAGGPAILDGRLVGIISFGPTVCGFVDAPTVFTTIGAFTDWIETINETMPNYYTGAARTTTTTKSPLNEFLATYKVRFAGHRKTTYFPAITQDTSESVEDMEPSPPVETTTEHASETPPPSPLALREGEDSDGGWSIDLVV
ncbi:hypothetical protein HF086_005946 [Spodoptera exigua]|uniref:Peptidase S1 domain-containing protein n=1 Tax=Spodoptera exigua TaxID=7107 RepID=A0A922MV78_SPOEX|nr:hypothetical protein HF086_005946 [Spodoptera exigua]